MATLIDLPPALRKPRTVEDSSNSILIGWEAPPNWHAEANGTVTQYALRYKAASGTTWQNVSMSLQLSDAAPKVGCRAPRGHARARGASRGAASALCGQLCLFLETHLLSLRTDFRGEN